MHDETKQFHLGDVLSITTGRLVSLDLIGGVYNILNYMTGDELYTHQLGRASDECKPYLLETHAWLSEIDGDQVTTENWKDWLQEQVNLYGEFHAVRPIHQEDHEIIDPLEELASMVDESKIITVQIEPEEPDIPDVGDISWKIE